MALSLRAFAPTFERTVRDYAQLVQNGSADSDLLPRQQLEVSLLLFEAANRLAKYGGHEPELRVALAAVRSLGEAEGYDPIAVERAAEVIGNL